jgi:hypothetical protein
MSNLLPSNLLSEFTTLYDSAAKDQVWSSQSFKFRSFWNGRILSESSDAVSDMECDQIIRILDRNGKGNTKGCESVARAMVAQGAWRRMFNEIHSNKPLGILITDLLNEENPIRKAEFIDTLYKMNEGQGNNITGPSGNTINVFLAAYDPVKNLSIISLKDRKSLIEYFEMPVSFDWENTSIGTRIVATNKLILDELHSLGVTGSARTVSRFCYSPSVQALWKGQHIVKRTDKTVSVTIPTAPEIEEVEDSVEDSIRESMQIQALIAKIGTSMGFAIWLPRADRGRVLKAWNPEPGELLDELPLGYDSSTMKTVEQIDVLWLKRRSIVRAFEVEHTTSVYSGLLRMADLVALQPNLNIKLHIVAPETKRDKVIQEIMRPVFSLLEGRALSEICTYLSYGSIKEISELKHLAHLSDKIIDDYEENADE